MSVGSIIHYMVIDMNDKQLLTPAQLQVFLNGTVAVDFSVAAEERYDFIGRTGCRFGYRRLKRAEKAVVLLFLERVTPAGIWLLTRYCSVISWPTRH